MPARIPDHLIDAARTLRRTERLSLKAIHARLEGRISIGSLSALLRDEPLTADEQASKCSEAATRRNAERGRFMPPVPAIMPTPQCTLHPAAQAIVRVQAHLAAIGYRATPGPESSTALEVIGPDGRTIRLRVRSAHWRPGEGGIVVKTQTERGVPYTTADCDAIVGYHHASDTAYVFPVGMCGGSQRTGGMDDAGRWDRVGLLSDRLTSDCLTSAA